MTNFSAIFWAALVVNCAVTFRSSDYWKKLSGGEAAIEKEDANQKKAWEGLLKKYLIVYLLATLSDWLQGPYVYGTSRPWSKNNWSIHPTCSRTVISYFHFGYFYYYFLLSTLFGLQILSARHCRFVCGWIWILHDFRQFCGGHGRLGWSPTLCGCLCSDLRSFLHHQT